jgi:glyoxylase-like metal-dependent hydrolase (beta-lactamase superfamily II)
MIISEEFEYEEVKGYKFGYNLFGKPNLFSHIYYVDGLMIDTGHSLMRRQITQKVKSLLVNQLFITHFHEDHSGNLDLLHPHFKCPIYASALCCELMKNPPKISFAQKLTWGNRPAFQGLIPISGTIKTNQFEFEIIPIPGHAPDMLALFEPRKKWLFSADLYLNSYIGYFLEDESISEQINSIKRVLKLDFEVLFCSHNPQFTSGKEKLRKKLLYLEKFYSQVAELSKEEYNAKEIFKTLNLREHGNIKLLSDGKLSKLNMVKSVLRDIQKTSSLEHSQS